MNTATYCTNIHPGESWAEIFAAVCEHVPVVRQRFAANDPFPLGLRLSGRAAAEITDRDARLFKDWCRDTGIYVATLNAFPYGTFHHAPVKQSVYLPDWRDPERLAYTTRAASLLAGWLPEGLDGSISTVPGGLRGDCGAEDWRKIADHIEAALAHLESLQQESGKTIVLALEPEPGCMVETIADVIAFFDRLDLSPARRSLLAVCYDCCHQALQFEEPADSLRQLAAHEIKIGHVQVSSALRLLRNDIGRLARFHESCYLHQTVGRTTSGELLRFLDLDEAISTAPPDVEEWRVHFHVPVFLEATPECGTTRFYLERILPLFPAHVPLEVETYTWTVLPDELRTDSVTASICREIEWVNKTRGAA